LTTKDYIKQLEQTIIQLTAERDTAIQRIQELERKNGELEKENEELKKKLLFYDNPHTPPSARSLQNTKKTTTENTFPPKKRGAPFGHRGATRPAKEPDEIVDVVASECENCGSSRIEKLENCEKSVIEDLPPPQKIKVTQYNRWEVKWMRYRPDVESPKYLDNNIVNGDLVDQRIEIKPIKNNRRNMGKETKGNSS
jgi:hypothetical protein